MPTEQDFIALVSKFFKEHPRIRLGPGDDAAVITEISTQEFVISVDAMVEDVHFHRNWLEIEDLGYRALAAALSDIAAMGAIPLTFLVNLGIPADFSLANVEELYNGFKTLGDEFCISPSGGNFYRSPKISIGVTVIGEVRRDMEVRRCCAQAGDVIAITGDVGRVAAAIHLLKDPFLSQMVNHKVKADVVSKFRRPKPRINEMQSILRNTSEVHAAIDISDGLASDILKIAQLSGLEAVLYEEKIPVHPSVNFIAEKLHKPVWQIVASSGEEFELLVVLPKEELQKLRSANINLTEVGEFRPTFKPTVKIRRSIGEEVEFTTGFDHFVNPLDL